MNPCGDCPFKTDSPLAGAPDWLLDVLKFKRENKYLYHSCHKTDKKADGYVRGEKKECVGHLLMILNDEDGTPGKEGVYKSVDHMTARYLLRWHEEKILTLKDEEILRCKGLVDDSHHRF